jgi:hypothetical protein
MFNREQRSEMLAELSVVLERLWTFHQAMRSGRPVEDAEMNLAQLKTAMTHGAQRMQTNFGATVSHVASGTGAVESRPA